MTVTKLPASWLLIIIMHLAWPGRKSLPGSFIREAMWLWRLQFPGNLIRHWQNQNPH